MVYKWNKNKRHLESQDFWKGNATGNERET